MGTFTRRDFLRTSFAGAGLAISAPQVVRAVPKLATQTGNFSGDEIVELGKTGVKVSFLAQGTGYNGHDHSSEQTRGQGLFRPPAAPQPGQRHFVPRHGRSLRLATLRQGGGQRRSEKQAHDA